LAEPLIEPLLEFDDDVRSRNSLVFLEDLLLLLWAADGECESTKQEKDNH
jgi:hypothetical protein